MCNITNCHMSKISDKSYRFLSMYMKRKVKSDPIGKLDMSFYVLIHWYQLFLGVLMEERSGEETLLLVIVLVGCYLYCRA